MEGDNSGMARYLPSRAGVDGGPALWHCRRLRLLLLVPYCATPPRRRSEAGSPTETTVATNGVVSPEVEFFLVESQIAAVIHAGGSQWDIATSDRRLPLPPPRGLSMRAFAIALAISESASTATTDRLFNAVKAERTCNPQPGWAPADRKRGRRSSPRGPSCATGRRRSTLRRAFR